ncbi:polyketide synthase [Caballeronia udeis]|uniref:Polyketide synthase n=1 Tax=Caballeronia udeis TaxID=1232866 RepID=A0A158GNC9_9BURK|nr:SDR family NAD(P)-dependent oxidoreductase [Caballeronia udeis]SAL32890.1 polyketide synthase [Caballeronia udeis]
MMDFIEYVVAELKVGRLSRDNVLDLIKQFSLNTDAAGTQPSVLHPLLHRNVSDIYRQCYGSSFDGTEFFLNDHQVVADGQASVKVLPGVAYLEMVRAAAADAIPELSGADGVQLDDVVWLKPITVSERKDVLIVLYAADAVSSASGALAIEFEILGVEPGADDEDEEVVHCRGVLKRATRDVPERIDLEALRARMGAGRLDAGVVYPAYQAMGMRFGPAHQAVECIFQGNEELLAHLRLPATLDGTQDAYVLHPSLTDGALQAAIGFLGDLRQLPNRPSLPFALDVLRVVAACPSQMYAWIRRSPGSRPGDKVSRLDIDLCDGEGNVCVELRGFASRTLGADAALAAREKGLVLVVAAPVWRPSALAAQQTTFAARHHVLLCDLPAVSADELRAAMPEVACRDLAAHAANVADRYTASALALFDAIRSIMSDLPEAGAFIHLVVADTLDGRLLAGLSGLLKSAALENPALQAQLLLVGERSSVQELAAHLRWEARQGADAMVRYAQGVRHALAWEELDDDGKEAPIAYKDHGVYLITGGLGGLGMLFAKEILQQTAHARIVLTGRADYSLAVGDKLSALAPDAASRARVFYSSLNLMDAADVCEAVAGIVKTHGRLDGILHGAGMIRDSLLATKSAGDFAHVLAPKVLGTVNLDLASQHVELDFLALFSSGASVAGNAGQADYAAANGFLDQFASYRNGLGERGLRRGRTLSINWPLWRDGGMRMPERDQQVMREVGGMEAMQTSVGMTAFYRALASSQAQTVVIAGDLRKIRAILHGEPIAPGVQVAEQSVDPAVPAPAPVDPAARDLRGETQDYLRKQFAALFKLPRHKIDPHASLDKYGIDSILAMDLIRQLEKTFGPLSKTLMFEYQSVDELTDYFMRSHAARLVELFAAPAAAAVGPQQARIDSQAPQTGARRRAPRGFAPVAAAKARAGVVHDEPIAIVGLSGRYPKAVDIDAYWLNLSNGEDCITEVPPERWDWREYYSDDRSTPGAHYSKWGGFIEGVDEFDPLFFNIPPVDAEFIDPQERLFLQHAWMAIEDAGQARASLQIPHESGLAGQVGVYVGVMYGEYQLFGAEASLRGRRIGVPVSYASIANRVSYLLNLHGPSMTVDSMCSSSLTAIHLACQDLKLGRTSLAIAGGVNVTIHPNKYLILSAGQYISSDGHCQSFGEGGDGYIPGEGVGAVVLKRLSEAERDGNIIYGVLKGSALNHGGKTNGYSVPNPKAQAGVIRQALKEAGVDARHVSYIEAHGTGTRLGDPIEITALNDVFREYTGERQYCAIGSIKSNIGHCESAAGIAGLTKVLLQMKHQMLVPSLHSSALNPHIDFASSPFVVNQTLRAWEQPEVDGRRQPRIAGLSSFGAGGSNAHLVIEEYLPPARDDGAAPLGQILVPLSARTPERLKQKARELLAWIERRKEAAGEPAIDLPSLAYTLQIGREAMDARAAFIVDSVSHLAEKLGAYCRDEQDIEDCFSAQVGEDQDGLSALSHDEDMIEAVDKWIARGKHSRLAELWVKGFALDWRKLHGARKLRFISLPTYPFAKNRYWIANQAGTGALQAAASAALHPLLHTNISDLFQQGYASQFSGHEFFLADHQIDTGSGAKRKVLPAVAYLEMMRAAADLAVPTQGEPRVWEIRDVVWSQPVVVDKPTRVSVLLSPAGEGGVEFRVISVNEGAEEPVAHCSGQAVLAQLPAEVRTHDIEALKARMSRGTLDARALYGAYRTMGIHYGPTFQGVAAIHRGEDELIAELALPGRHDDGAFVLPPGLMDSALQSSLGLIDDLTHLPRAPSVPFALDALVVLSACTPRMFAWVRRVSGTEARNGIVKIDIDLCDANGNVCVCLRGLTSRVMQDGAAQSRIGALIAQPVWEAVASDASALLPANEYRTHQVVLCDLPNVDANRLVERMPGAKVVRLELADADDIAGRYRVAALACFDELQVILKQQPRDKVLYQLVIGGGEHALLAGLAGLIDTARLEQPNLCAQLVLTEASADESMIAHQLQRARHSAAESLLKFDRGAPSGLRWQNETVREANPAAFKDQGVYLITGGLGGLGLLFAREILSRAQGATVILSGRSELSEAQRTSLAALASELSVAPECIVYRKLDVERLTELEALVAGIIAQFGALTGVIHSAGMVRDGLIVNKTAEQFTQVLAPKVAGTVHLDLATRHLELDFLALFSSLAAVRGNVGQADYAAANGFMDRFAAHRNRLVEAGQRHGRTLAINWPLWRDGGMHMDADALAMLTRASGMVAMQTATGIDGFHQALASQAGRVLVVEGDVERLARLLSGPRAPAPTPASADVPVPAEPGMDTHSDERALREAAQRYLIGEFSGVLKVPAHELDARAPLERYGIDSVLTMKLTQQIENRFGVLSKTLLFEYQTIAALAGYLARTFPQALRDRADAVAPRTPAEPSRLPPTAPGALRLAPSGVAKARFAAPTAERGGDVAIIGIAGKYPQADNLREFWENLRNGRDCITEVPRERWDHARIFHPERNQPGKTYAKWGGFIDGVDRFDALFFGISPKEAELMDPQERLFIETVWETIEDAGYGKDGMKEHNVGVYVGAMWGQYELYGVSSGDAGVPSSSFASIANRVSYFFDFHGPSLALDTMCSSSLTAIHLACEDIRKGTVDVAVAGGVNVSIHPSKYVSLSQGNFVSTDGRCRSFGAGGDGYVPGEGVGAVLLKSLDRAIADGDQIHAVVKAGSINHGGKTNGYTVPNPVAQASLIRETFEKARIAPQSIDYIETHGTGTSLGDPIEITGLVRAFAHASGGAQNRQENCPIGSVKSNIGHLESAAGIAALTKVVLQFKHEQLVPSLHAETLNPHIDFDATPFRVQTALEDWKRHDGQPHRACISSFGAGGSNAHLIVEAFTDPRVSPRAAGQPEAFLISARSRTSLVAYVEKMLAFFEEDRDLSWRDIAYTSQVGRTPMQERLVVLAASAQDLRQQLLQWLRNASSSASAQALEDVYEGSTRGAQAGASALIEGDAGDAFLRLTLQKRDLAKLAKLWVSGVEIDWAQLHHGAGARRVSLPGYPFVRERYWIDAQPHLPSDGASHAEADAVQPPQLLHYRTTWHAAHLSDLDAGRRMTGALLLLDVGDELAAEMVRAREGQAAVVVQSTASYAQTGPDRFTVDPASEADFDRLMDVLQQSGLVPQAIVHRALDHGGIDRQLDQGVGTLHGLVKALMHRKPQHTVHIVSLQWRTRESGDGALHAALGGYLRSLAHEHPKFAGKTVVIGDVVSVAEIAQRVWAELGDTRWRDREIRYLADGKPGGSSVRRHVRQIERYVPARRDAAANTLIKHGGVYLVTGGLGGLGYIISTHLAKSCRAKLVLTGRSALDAEQERKLANLRAQGADAIYLQADVSARSDVDAVLAGTRRKFGRINGVIHSAGVHRDALALNKTREQMASVFAAKITGTVHLDLATREEPLDLFVLFSSIAGVFGNAGQTDYAYANRFLDEYADARQALVGLGERHGKTLSISWPFWEDGGMRIAPAELDLMRRRTGTSPLPTDLGLEAWESALRSPLSHCIVLFGDASRIDAYATPGPSGKASAAEAGAEAHADRALDVPYRAASDDQSLKEATEGYLKALLSNEIKLPVDRIDAEEPFDSFGVDSMMIGRMNSALERDLGELPKTLFYLYASIDELASYLSREASRALIALLKPAPREEASVPAGRPAEQSNPRAAMVTAPDEKIAIIGLHGQFPGAADPAAFWEHLKEGRDLVSLVPETRWDAHAFFDEDPDSAKNGKIYSKWGGFLDDVDKFDAPFFSIAADDARVIDPQERLFLQSVWAAIEDAGYTRESLKQRFPKSESKSADVGVFCGVTTNSYNVLAPQEWLRGNMAAPASMPWSITNRVSYVFDFQGPSMPVDTACSSSLVAMHLACESLRRSECQVAIAGGVNLYLHPSKYHALCHRRMLARGAQCRSFGAGDDGFVPGEGVGAVVLKPLSRAIVDGDRIYGVIAASACEHSGRSNGYSAPNPNSQASLIAQTMRKADLHPESISYVEGHGTGTQLGDNLEVASLSRAFRAHTDKQQFCALGSVKSNVGHSESAAGITGVTKILLQFLHRQLAPTLHSREVNPNIDFDGSPFRLQHELTAWEPAAGTPRRAMINSFGAGGVNACLILDEYVPAGRTVAPSDGALHLIVLSAKNEQKLREVAGRLRAHLANEADADLAALAYTLQTGRESFEERLAIVVSHRDGLLRELETFCEGAQSSAALLRGRVEPHRRKKISRKPEEYDRLKSLHVNGGWQALAKEWIEGQEIDWNGFHAERPAKLSLPTYPFAKERYWVSDAAPRPIPAARPQAVLIQTQLHPLVSENASTLKEVCFSSWLSGDAYYARDHRVNGKMIFPGAGYLEMACAAGTIAGEQAVVVIEDIVWNQPLPLAAGRQLVKTVLKLNGDNAGYVIVSFDEDDERIVHSEGRLEFGARSRRGDEAPMAIAALKAKCSKTLQGAVCYQQLEQFGFRYGPSFQTIDELHLGAGFALSKLRVADALVADFEQYHLHPTLIDGALQTVLGVAGEGRPDVPHLPFALGRVEIFRPLSPSCYAYVEPTPGTEAHPSGIRQFDIRLMNESGEVLVKLNKLYVRALLKGPAGRSDEFDNALMID